MYGRCLHRGALLADGFIRGDDLICGLHNWDYRYETGVSSYNNKEALHQFKVFIEGDKVLVDEDEIESWEKKNPQPYERKEYLGNYQDIHGTSEEPYNIEIQSLAKHGLKNVGHHGAVTAMGVDRNHLPVWEDIQIQTAQLAKLPLFDKERVSSDLIIGKKAKKPLKLQIPIFVSDMSFGALSEEAKISLSRGLK